MTVNVYLLPQARFVVVRHELKSQISSVGGVVIGCCLCSGCLNPAVVVARLA